MLCLKRPRKDGSTKEPSEPELNSIATDKDLLAEIRSRWSDLKDSKQDRDTGDEVLWWKSNGVAVIMRPQISGITYFLVECVLRCSGMQ